MKLPGNIQARIKKDPAGTVIACAAGVGLAGATATITGSAFQNDATMLTGIGMLVAATAISAAVIRMPELAGRIPLIRRRKNAHDPEQ